MAALTVDRAGEIGSDDETYWSRRVHSLTQPLRADASEYPANWPGRVARALRQSTPGLPDTPVSDSTTLSSTETPYL